MRGLPLDLFDAVVGGEGVIEFLLLADLRALERGQFAFDQLAVDHLDRHVAARVPGERSAVLRGVEVDDHEITLLHHVAALDGNDLGALAEHAIDLLGDPLVGDGRLELRKLEALVVLRVDDGLDLDARRIAEGLLRFDLPARERGVTHRSDVRLLERVDEAQQLHALHHVGLDLAAKLLLEDAARNLSRAEARHLHLAREDRVRGGELLLDEGRFHLDGQALFDAADVFDLNLHGPTSLSEFARFFGENERDGFRGRVQAGQRLCPGEIHAGPSSPDEPGGTSPERSASGLEAHPFDDRPVTDALSPRS